MRNWEGRCNIACLPCVPSCRNTESTCPLRIILHAKSRWRRQTSLTSCPGVLKARSRESISKSQLRASKLIVNAHLPSPFLPTSQEVVLTSNSGAGQLWSWFPFFNTRSKSFSGCICCVVDFEVPRLSTFNFIDFFFLGGKTQHPVCFSKVESSSPSSVLITSTREVAPHAIDHIQFFIIVFVPNSRIHSSG